MAIFVANLYCMKLVTYLKDGHDHLAMLINGMLYDMDSIHPELPFIDPAFYDDQLKNII
jgi:hypothetical protein